MSGVRFRYQTVQFGEIDFRLRTLLDNQQCPTGFVDSEELGVSSATWPLFGQLWQSEELLSTLMVDQKIADTRILEVGCGTAMASIVLKQRGADITATDYNPETAAYLTTNTELNHLDPIRCECLNWHESNPVLGRFDLIIGSDLLYDHHNVKPLVRFLKSHAKPNCSILIVDPRRGLTGPFIRQIKEIGFSVQAHQQTYPVEGEESSSFLVMRFSRLDT